MADFNKTNIVRIIGTLESATTEIKNSSRDGHEYIIVNAVVSSVINGVRNEYDVRFMANKLTADKKINKLFEQYQGIETLIGKKVDINGSLRTNRFFSTRNNQIVNSQTIDGKFIHGTVESAIDVATFTITGFIAQLLTEKTNKEGKVYRYDIVIGQGNYANDCANLFTLHVDPTNSAVVKGITNSYKIGDTVQFNGALNFKVEHVTVEDKNSAFGEPLVRTYTNRQRNFYILGGSNPLTVEDGAYPSEIIQALIAGYKAKDVELSAAATSNASSDESDFSVPPTKNVSTRQTSLI